MRGLPLQLPSNRAGQAMDPDSSCPSLSHQTSQFCRTFLEPVSSESKFSSAGCPASIHSTWDINPVCIKSALWSLEITFPFLLSILPISSFLPNKTPVGFSPENNAPRSSAQVHGSGGKLRSAWQPAQLSFEANRWWRLNDSSLTASFEVIGDNLYFESELDHCQKGRRLIWKRFYISPCFLCCSPSPLLSFCPSDPCFFNPCSRQLVKSFLG